MTSIRSLRVESPLPVLCVAAAAGILLSAPPPAAQTPAGQDAPRILFTASPRAVEYQLNRLTNHDLIRVERSENDLKYRPVYVALLTRRGLGREYFDEALAALGRMDKASPARVLLDALAKVAPEDVETADKILRFLFAQPVLALRSERGAFARAVDLASPPFVLRGAYGGMMLADGEHTRAWEIAVKREGHLSELLRCVPQLAPAAEVRGRLFEPIAALLTSAADAPTRTAALAALGSTRQDAATFRLLAQEVITGADAGMRAAAVRSLTLIPASAWPAGEVEPLARAIVAQVEKTAPSRRTEPDTIEAIDLGEKLADALGDEPRRAVRRDLRALGVQVVRIETVPEKMAFDLKWFAVEAGKAVQIVLFNPDAMSHNLLISKPGSLQEVGTLASTMTLSADPKVKPYVPDTPLVLHATRLLNWGETERLSFTAPKEPGEYIYVCTFPGHWVRMYGVMLVVEKLEAWEAAKTVPTDPMTKKPFDSRRM
jgi:azurin